LAGNPKEHSSPPPDRLAGRATGTALFTGVGTVCETVTRLAGVDGAAVAVFAPSATRELVYATDALAQQIDDLQFTLGEGPCLEAYHSGSLQSCPRLDEGPQVDLWPSFCGGATELGVRAIFAFPVLAPDSALGVLELYRRSSGNLEVGQLESARVCAIAIADTLMQNWSAHLSWTIDAVAAIEAISTDPDGVSDSSDQFSRARVYIASGMVAVQLGVSADEGLDRLRAHTYAQGRPINEVAADIMARRLSLRDFRDDREDG
jgi:GAF domain